MQLEPIERVTPMQQDRLDDWFDVAMQDESVRPFLTTGVHFPRLTIPEDTYDGVVLMNRANTGVLKLYTDEESQTMKIGIWVLEPSEDAPSRSVTALSLMKGALVIADQNPRINYFGTRVMSTNYHGINFSDRLFTMWGVESNAVYDTTGTQSSWVNWVHYRAAIANVREAVNSWERNLIEKS